MKIINDYLKEFADDGNHNFKFKIGRILASSLSGFIAGVVLSSIIWAVTVYLLGTFR